MTSPILHRLLLGTLLATYGSTAEAFSSIPSIDTRAVVPSLSSPSWPFHLSTKQRRAAAVSESLSNKSHTRLYNLLDAMGEMLRGPKLDREENLPYHPPFCEESSICEDKVRTFAIKERPISFTGEDFDIVEITDNQNTDFVRVRGAMLHLPGKDKMRVKSSTTGQSLVTMDRVLIAATPSYDLYRDVDGTKIGWMEKKLISFMDTFDIYMEGKGGFGVTGLFKPTPAYRIEGDFFDRNFCFRNEQGKVVARANMDGWIQFDGMNHYQVQVAEGMDAHLVLACVCCIDEEFDEEHKKRKEERKRKEEED
mmetsp:Transcript_27179/g.57179  ORF Transcript_27179/g.57179 Transcript_27179/m.57179 type:complete len:309 (+) Transcript_27179:113-1039(+)